MDPSENKWNEDENGIGHWFSYFGHGGGIIQEEVQRSEVKNCRHHSTPVLGRTHQASGLYGRGSGIRWH